MAPASLWDNNTRSRAFLVRFSISNVRSSLLIETALKWFDAQGAVSEYEGGRDLDSLVNLCVYLIHSPPRSSSYVVLSALRRSQALSQRSNLLPLPRRSALTPTLSTKSFLYAFYGHLMHLLLNTFSCRTRIMIRLSRSLPLGVATARI